MVGSILLLQLIFDIAIAICKCKELVFNSIVLLQKNPPLLRNKDGKNCKINCKKKIMRTCLLLYQRKICLPFQDVV